MKRGSSVALKFRLRGLAETFVDNLQCPSCGKHGTDDQHFETDHTRVTYDGIIVVAQCRSCKELFVPDAQRLGVINPSELKKAVEKDSEDTGEPPLSGIGDVRLDVERLNSLRKSAGLN
jgi:hypothetical protein